MNESFFSFGLHLGSGTQIHCCTYPDKGPILSIDIEGGWLNLTPYNTADVTASDVANAKALVKQTQIYLAECERVHADQAANQAAA